MGLFSKFDKYLTKAEKKGYNAANFIHKFSVNCILVFIIYSTYSGLSEYNTHFKEKRNPSEVNDLHEANQPETTISLDFSNSKFIGPDKSKWD